jgi:predicted unusual protein kinase regulating ubiquinone biosynthesis (AarF/ABC1/UbiB family)
MDVRALAAELRERVSEELDYEIEAQNHRAVARAWRGHPFVHVPPVDTQRSRRRVLVTELISGKRFEEVKRLDEAGRDRFGEIVFRFFFGTLKYTRRASGDPHPGNYLLMDDGRVGFLDFGLMRVVDADYLEGERRLAQAVARGDAEAVHSDLAALGYLPQPDTFDSDRLLDQIRTAGEWYLEPGFKRLSPTYVTDLIDRGSSPRSAFFEEMRRETIPPQALLIRRMEGLVLSTLGELRAGADWSKLGSEYWSDAPPSTPLGEADARFWGLPGFTG